MGVYGNGQALMEMMSISSNTITNESISSNIYHFQIGQAWLLFLCNIPYYILFECTTL